MKIIANPKNWKNPILVDSADEAKVIAILQQVSKHLDIPCVYNKEQNKLYIGDQEPAEEPKPLQAVFTCRLPSSPANSIIDGCIMLDGEEYKACSGIAGYQVFGKYFDRYCPIPPGEYEINLAWYPLDTIGIEGPFYHILPDPIRDPAGSGKQRSEIGLHKDANTPGTAGCIGVVGKDFTRIHYKLQQLANKMAKLPLKVVYLKPEK